MVVTMKTDSSENQMNHVLRNGTMKIQGCLVAIEQIVNQMNKAIEVFEVSIKKTVEDKNE